MMQFDGNTKVLGIFGDPVAHSLSPKMQNAAIEAAGINAVYVPFHIRPEQLQDAVEAIRAIGLLGVSVTVPHKEAVMPFLDEIDSGAQLIGAVNTVVNRDGRLIGYNTDGLGLLKSLDQELGFNPHGKKTVLFGAGGAARAAIVALAQSGVSHLVVGNRTAEKAERLVRGFSGHFPGTSFSATSLESDLLQSALAETDLLVNTTTIGLHGEAFPVRAIKSLSESASFYDMVYTSGLTPLQSDAQGRGLNFTDGRGMLAGQGEEAFRLWFGVQPPDKIMHSQIAK